MNAEKNFSTTRRRPKPAAIALIVLLHIAALYGLARAFAPDMVQSAQDSVVGGLTVIITAPDEPPPQDPEPVPDEGTAGDPGVKAVPKAVTAPTPKRPLKQDKPAPKASSTGTANRSGAKDSGDGTGASGQGEGTGSGRAGSGMGGVAVTKPEHISGSINNARDYPVPEGGRAARLGTEVIVKVTVGVDGRARDCSIFRSSPDAEADRLTCQLVVNRLGFKPATDGNGNPVAAPFYWRQRWF